MSRIRSNSINSTGCSSAGPGLFKVIILELRIGERGFELFEQSGIDLFEYLVCRDAFEVIAAVDLDVAR